MKSGEPGFLDGHFLIAMPGMLDERFSRAVVYLCAHSDDGAMGLIVNQPQGVGFSDLLVQLGLVKQEDAIRLPEMARVLVVRNGGPVDRSRGFVLHSQDYATDSTLAVSDTIALTATVDILKAISQGIGPKQALMALGYSGWGAGQLEQEIADNGWLVCPATDDLLFDSPVETVYERALNKLNVDPARLSNTTGHA
ncbi:UPF0301 protein [Limoniibacter endophyticus]|uniref:UPF0301 protein GCM10010136_18860 n=2 Tax=Limoniibacter endophyticus TaxID=1565040 RepID=A0A8J3DMS7_9HYPH|nr:UPF0301 protein [Limoniibacter endophyticus]